MGCLVGKCCDFGSLCGRVCFFLEERIQNRFKKKIRARIGVRFGCFLRVFVCMQRA